MKFGFDIIFFAVIGLSAIGSFFLGEEKAQRLALGVIIGSFASTQFAEPLAKLASGKIAIIDQTIIVIAIMVLCVTFCMLGKNVRDKKWPRSKVKAIIYGVLASLVAIAYTIASLPSDTRQSLVTDHNLAALAYDLRLYLAGALVAWILITYLTVGKAKK
jgi:hypothetical protein